VLLGSAKADCAQRLHYDSGMGQPVTVTEKRTASPNLARFETNRVLTGMGHEFYRSEADAVDDRPADRLARRLFARGGVVGVHVNANVVTVHLDPATRATAEGLKEIIEGLYTYYLPGVEPPSDEELLAQVES
jgi:hypothetical protein